MPNISILSYCNIHCPYCFAQQMFDDQHGKTISIEQFDKILKWIAPAAEETFCRIGIIGGEPTLHPQLETILEHTSAFCNKYNSRGILFTNGIQLTPEKIKMIPDNIGILINCNHPSVYPSEQIFTQFQKNLDFLASLNWIGPSINSKVTLGCTLCQEINDYQFFYNLIKKYNCKSIRSAIDMSNGKFKDHIYLEQAKIKFLNLIDFCIDQDIQQLWLDCRLPISFFTKNELEKIFKVVNEEDYKAPCYHSFEILPDFTASGCFSLYNPIIDCSKYSSFKELNEKENQVGMYHDK